MKVPAPEIERRLERLRAACKEARAKLTYQRLEIFRELASSLEHPSAEKIYQAIHPRMPSVSMDTVYRTLSFLSELGVATALGPRRESVRFDANLDPHHHYVCLRCGATRDFLSERLDRLPVQKALREMGLVLAVRVEVRGLCKDCAPLGRRSGGKVRTPPEPTRKRPSRAGRAK